MWISSFPTTTCKRGCGFSNVYFWHVFHESDSCSFLGLFLELQFYSSGPFVCCVAVPYCYGSEVYFQVRRGISNIAFCKQQLHPIMYIYTFKKTSLSIVGILAVSKAWLLWIVLQKLASKWLYHIQVYLLAIYTASWDWLFGSFAHSFSGFFAAPCIFL
jgi:hypothetical protein